MCAHKPCKAVLINAGIRSITLVIVLIPVVAGGPQRSDAGGQMQRSERHLLRSNQLKSLSVG